MKNLIDDAKSVGIIGLAKNTGKTTTLNKLIDLYDDLIISITSIGLDGEDLDQVNFLPKPKINFKKGMIVATATKCLEHATLKYEILENTIFQTSLGFIVIIKVIDEGKMIVAGPTTNKDLNDVINLLKKYSDKVFIDGAFDRRTFTNLKYIENIIIATGASYDNDMFKTINDTLSVINLFSMKKTNQLKSLPKYDMLIRLNNNKEIGFSKDFDKLKMMMNDIKIINYLFIKGAITNDFIMFIVYNKFSDFKLIIEDPTKALFDLKYLKYLDQLNINIEVVKSINISFLTINPFSPNGYHYDKDIFLQEMKKKIDLPIFNVNDMEE